MLFSVCPAQGRVEPHLSNGCNKKAVSSQSWWRYGESGTPSYVWEECKMVQPLWETVWAFLKMLLISLLQTWQFQSHPGEINSTSVWRLACECSHQHFSKCCTNGNELHAPQQRDGWTWSGAASDGMLSCWGQAETPAPAPCSSRENVSATEGPRM